MLCHKIDLNAKTQHNLPPTMMTLEKQHICLASGSHRRDLKNLLAAARKDKNSAECGVSPACPFP